MTHSYKFESSEPHGSFDGGTFYRASKKKFPALRGLAIQALHLKAGAVREPHSHPNAEQLDYCVRGKARVGIIGPEGHRQLLDLEAGDISFVPQGFIHWIENTGDDDMHFLVVLSDEEPLTIELSETLAGVPNDVLSKVLGLSEGALSELPEKAVTIGAPL
jgi:oxalate decarboxylase/phosphoglucose isomerase-like protein (cupin superfamily)